MTPKKTATTLSPYCQIQNQIKTITGRQVKFSRARSIESLSSRPLKCPLHPSDKWIATLACVTKWKPALEIINKYGMATEPPSNQACRTHCKICNSSRALTSKNNSKTNRIMQSNTRPMFRGKRKITNRLHSRTNLVRLSNTLNQGTIRITLQTRSTLTR